MSFLLILFFNCLIFNSIIQGANEEDLPKCSDICPCCTCLDEIAIEKLGNKKEKFKIDQENLKNLEEECKKKILGQDEIVKEVCEMVKSALLVGGEEPCVILLGGAPGCGKTSLVETIAQHIYGDNYENFYQKINMQSYNGEQYVSTLVGSANGYVGDEGIIAKFCRQEKKIILFDEIEKAHNAVCKTLLSLLEGKKTNTGKGTKCWLPKNCVVFMTTNSGNVFLDKIKEFNDKHRQNAKDNADIIKISLRLGLDSNGDQNKEHSTVGELIDRITKTFAMKTVKNPETIKNFIKNCIEDTVKELNKSNQNIVLSSEGNIEIENIYKKHITEESSMRKIKKQTSIAIKKAFAQFIINNDISLEEYNGPPKTIKLKWENDEFKCEEEENGDEAEI